MNHLVFSYRAFLKQQGLTERGLARSSGVSRGSLRKLAIGEVTNTSVIQRVSLALGLKTRLLVFRDDEPLSDFSAYAVSIKVVNSGFDSWKIHFMDMVDEFRRSLDMRLFVLSPSRDVDERLRALLASIVCSLSEEAGQSTPAWARRRHYLDQPWFVSGMESLKASSILESPLVFRANNIFVQANFLERA